MNSSSLNVNPLLTLLSVVGLAVDGICQDKADGFVSIFDGQSMEGWLGNIDGYEAKDGVLACLPGKGMGGNIFTEKEYGNA